MMNKNHSKTIAGIGMALLLVALTPLAAAHAASTHTIGSGQGVCIGPAHVITAGSSITVSATWTPSGQNIQIGVCDATPNPDGSCPANPTGASTVTVAGGAASATFTAQVTMCAWPAAFNPGPNTVTVTISSTP